MLRPEQVTVVSGAGATVRTVDYLGPFTRYELTAGDAPLVVATAPGPPAHAVGDAVGLRVDDTAHAWAGVAVD